MNRSMWLPLGAIGAAAVLILFAGNNLADWAWWSTSGTRQEQVEFMVLAFNSLGALCIVLGGALGGQHLLNRMGDWPPSPGPAPLAAQDLRVERELFFGYASDARVYDWVILLGFVSLAIGFTLIAFSRGMS